MDTQIQDFVWTYILCPSRNLGMAFQGHTIVLFNIGKTADCIPKYLCVFQSHLRCRERASVLCIMAGVS